MKTQSLIKRIDEYIENQFALEDEELQFAIQNSKKHNLPPIQITPVLGKFLYIQAKIVQAKNILELGTLGGYSTLWLAKALPQNGAITTIEHNKDYANIAQENFNHAAKENIKLVIGEANDILPTLSEKFDFIFIDANKEEYCVYIELVKKLAHPGTIIICDNVIRNGGVLEENPEKKYYRALAEFNSQLAQDPAMDTTILPVTLPLTGRDYIDGLSISIVK